MARAISDEAKEFEGNGGGQWLGFGVHEVQIMLIDMGELDSGTEYMEFTVVGKSDEEERVRLWITDKSEKYTFATLKSIYTHCAPEDKKEAAKEALDKCKDYDEVLALLQKCIGKQVWITKYPDPSRTYTNSQGETKRSINTNIYGYEPKLREDLMPKDDQKEELNKTFPGAEDVTNTEAAKGIPEDWA